jgi:UDP-GlcNAc:undecaprenyl-phosphate GlcNAc-1-phosphate transferase
MISPFIFSINRVTGSYLASSAVILMLGIIDDVRGSDWKLKLAFSVIATSIFMFGSNIWIDNLGNLFGSGFIHMGLWGIPFTFFAVFGVMNAINLIDGLDGLACGISCITFTAFAIFAYISGNHTVYHLSLATLGATLGLLIYNYPRAKIFMGDSGSLFLGFSLAVMSILLTQGGGKVRPMVPVIILGLPIFDTLRVMTVRMLNNKHPFQGDKTHLHHLMLRSGIPRNRVVITIWVLSFLMMLRGSCYWSFALSLRLSEFLSRTCGSSRPAQSVTVPIPENLRLE